jgi:hypothetical protein
MTEALRAEPSLRAGAPFRVVGVQTVAEAPGRRRVLRYEVEGLDPARTVRLVGKVYTDRHRASIGYDNLRLLREEVFAATPCRTVPSPVCAVPALHLLLYREVTGTPMDRLPESAVPPTATLTARWLATLHGSAAVLARRADPGHDLADVEQWAGQVGDRAPGARAAAHTLVDRLAGAAAELPDVREVPVHRDLHAGHVLAVGTSRRTGRRGDEPAGIVVLDLDEARMGDPALDVAHVITYLDASAWPGAAAARAAFLRAYGPVPGPSPELRCAFFSACTSMKIAKQLVSGRGPVSAPSGSLRTALLDAVLRRGAACLGG